MDKVSLFLIILLLKKKGECTIVEFSGRQFTKSSAKILVDKSWETQVKRLDELALSCKVRIHVLKSFVLHADKSALYNVREQLHPNHYIGQALSVHLYDKNERLLCDEMCLKSDDDTFI